MTLTLKAWRDSAREYPWSFRMCNTAESVVAGVQAEESKAGEPVTDSESIAAAILEALGK